MNSYPEIAVGKKTTPRTLVGLFKQLAPISDWKANLKLVMSIAESLLDENTLAPFLNYIKSELEHFMGPDDLLSAEDFSTVRKKSGCYFQEMEMHRDWIVYRCCWIAQSIIYLPKDFDFLNLIAGTS